MSPGSILRRTAFCLTALLTLATVLPAQDAVTKEIMRLENVWADLYATHDAAGLSKIIADGYLAISDKGTPITKALMLKEVGSDTTHIISATNSNFKARVYGNTAVIIGIATIVSKGPKGNVTVRSGWTDTWMKQDDGKWLCVASQNIPVK